MKDWLILQLFRPPWLLETKMDLRWAGVEKFAENLFQSEHICQLKQEYFKFFQKMKIQRCLSFNTYCVKISKLKF